MTLDHNCPICSLSFSFATQKSVWHLLGPSYDLLICSPLKQKKWGRDQSIARLCNEPSAPFIQPAENVWLSVPPTIHLSYSVDAEVLLKIVSSLLQHVQQGTVSPCLPQVYNVYGKMTCPTALKMQSRVQAISTCLVP